MSEATEIPISRHTCLGGERCTACSMEFGLLQSAAYERGLAEGLAEVERWQQKWKRRGGIIRELRAAGEVNHAN